MNIKKTLKYNTRSNRQKRVVSLCLFALATNFAVSAYGVSVVAVADEDATTANNTSQVPSVSQDASGGGVVTVKSIRFTGYTRYTDVLTAVFADAVGKTFDLAGLQGLTHLITAQYRSNGVPFARALLPVQPMTDGALIIHIIEGRYGSVKAKGDDKRAVSAQVFLKSLQEGRVIESASLERASLILADQPGFDAAYTVSPGQASGTGDLDVRLERSARYSGEQGFDNYGNRFTGRSRGHVNLDINSPFFFGDQLKLNTLYSEENLWVGALNYSLPVGGTGLRASVGYARTNYELAKEFASAKAQGTAKISSAGLSYPIIRSQHANLSLKGRYQHKVLNNSDNITSSSNTNRSESLPISLSFDRRDQLAGGGVTYGDVSWMHGNLTVASANRAADRASAKTAGGFAKINLNLARLQALPANINFFGRISAQWASKNLDSSEKFGLGGVNGVRAYPSGEAFGDDGVLVQLEARYATNSFTPYVFFDAGTLNINHDTFTVGDNRLSLAGAGLGLRFNIKGWGIDASAAWRTTGTFSDVNQADTPRIWVSTKLKY